MCYGRTELLYAEVTIVCVCEICEKVQGSPTLDFRVKDCALNCDFLST